MMEWGLRCLSEYGDACVGVGVGLGSDRSWGESMSGRDRGEGPERGGKKEGRREAVLM